MQEEVSQILPLNQLHLLILGNRERKTFLAIKACSGYSDSAVTSE